MIKNQKFSIERNGRNPLYCFAITEPIEKLREGRGVFLLFWGLPQVRQFRKALLDQDRDEKGFRRLRNRKKTHMYIFLNNKWVQLSPNNILESDKKCFISLLNFALYNFISQYFAQYNFALYNFVVFAQYNFPYTTTYWNF